MVGHRWSDWQMSSLWLESVLISYPGDGDGGSIGLFVRVGSSGNCAGFIASDLFLGAGFFHLDAMAGLKAIENASMISCWAFAAYFCI